MKILDKVKEVLEEFNEHFDKIEAEFNRQNDFFKSLISKDHDVIGQVLKYHLIVEHYLNNYLAFKVPEIDISEARLTFAQKAKLLSQKDVRAAFVKPGIIELNTTRNKFSHNLNAELSTKELKQMLQVLSISREGVEYEDPVKVINDFSTVACTFLTVHPEEIDLLWEEIFEAMQNHEG